MIYLGADHRGFKLKEKIKDYLRKSKIDFEDLGNFKFEPEDDYPDFAKKVAERVAENPANRGILICGTGLGSCIAANKIKGIRATSAWSLGTAKHAREHLDANVLCLGARVLTLTEAKEILQWWLETEFSKGRRHLRRIEKIKKIER